MSIEIDGIKYDTSIHDFVEKLISDYKEKASINKLKFEIEKLWFFLETQTKMFIPRKNSFDNIYNCIIRQLDNSEEKIKTIGIRCFININNNHYLINGNKRVAFGILWLFTENDTWENHIDDLKYLEDK